MITLHAARAAAVALLALVSGCTSPARPPADVVVAPRPPPTAAADPPAIAGPPGSTAPAPRLAQVATAVDPCDPFANLTERREGDLTVPVEPRPIRPEFFGRLRHHADGALSQGSARVWFGPRVPRFVPLHEGTAELHLLEPWGQDGYVGVYRDPYGAKSCNLSDPRNCRMVVTGYDRCGKRLWSRELGDFMSRPTHLEVQDVRASDGVIYFNEACQSYSREAGGQCSALVALDPEAGKVLWRTRPLVSNNRILVLDRYVVAGYGFTAEADHVSLVRRRDGAVVHRRPLRSAHEDLALEGEGTLRVRIYPGDRDERFTLEGLDGDAARLVPSR